MRQTTLKLTGFTILASVLFTGCFVKQEALDKALEDTKVQLRAEHKEAIQASQTKMKQKSSQALNTTKTAMQSQIDETNAKLAKVKEDISKLNDNLEDVKNSTQIMEKFRSGLKELLDSL